MGYHKLTVMSLFRCALLIPSLLTPYVTAASPAHHAHLNHTDLEAGDEGVHGPSTVYMSDGIHVSEALASLGPSNISTQRDTPRTPSDIHDLSPVNLHRHFPEGQISSNSSDLQYGLITLGANSKSGAVDTVSLGSGYLLAVGESHGLAQLRKRDGQPDPFVFLDCPANVLDQPVNQTQKARVVCTSQDVEGCFRVRERGVEGTLVEMPDECAPNSFARAVSLEIAEDQTMPGHLAERYTPTSPIYEFSFDFNKHEGRVDAKVALRMDITNVRGYWDGLVDSPGVEKHHLERRYFSHLHANWNKDRKHGDMLKADTTLSPLHIKRDLSTAVFWQPAQMCSVRGREYDEGIGAYIQGNVDAKLIYAITVTAIGDRGSSKVDVKRAAGWMEVSGQTDLTFGVGGMGHLDISVAGKGNPAKNEKSFDVFSTQRIHAGSFWGFMTLTPFMSRQAWLGTSRMNESPSPLIGHPATLNGHLATRVKTDFGQFPASFPHPLTPKEIGHMEQRRKLSEMEFDVGNYLFSDGGERGSTIRMGHNLSVGLVLDFEVYPLAQGQPLLDVPREAYLLVTSETTARWDIPGSTNHRTCHQSSASSLLRQGVTGNDFLGWKNDQGSAILFGDYFKTSAHEPCNYSQQRKRAALGFYSPGNQSTALSTSNINKRGYDNPKDVFGTPRLRPVHIFGHVISHLFMRRRNAGDLSCSGGRCATCLDFRDRDGCCGCVCMQCIWGPRGDIPRCQKCTDEGDHMEAPWPGTHVKRDQISGNNIPARNHEGWAQFLKNLLFARARTVYTGWKDVRVDTVLYAAPRPGNSAPFRYPMFPKDVKKVWEGADGGIYDSISYYWGNTSADCSDWSLGLNRTRDQTNDPMRGWIPSAYETEHVYEGQNLGQFFDEWLTKGQIERQTPDPGITHGKVDAAWIETWIMDVNEDFPWLNPVDPSEHYSLFGQLHSELGNNYHKDRLAILQARLNRKKENVFDLSKSYSEDKYRYRMNHDQQWSTVKEIGLTFNYLNNDTIWGMWCDTYTSIHDRLHRFDSFYDIVKGPDSPDVSLAQEWGKYNRVVLDSAAKINGDGWDWTFENRLTNNPAMRASREEAIWQAIRARNPRAAVFHLKKSCPNLPPTTIV